MHPTPAVPPSQRQAPVLEALETRRLYAAHLSKDFATHRLVSTSAHVANDRSTVLEDPHGLDLFANGTLVTADSGNDTSNAYTLTGASAGGASPFAITFTDQPTSVIETDSAGFSSTQDGTSLPVGIMYGTSNGKVYGLLKANDTQLLIDDSSQGADFSGLTIGDDHLVAMLYLADMHNGRIDVYNNAYQLQSGFSFTDPNLPAGYVPDNITYQNFLIEVSYVKLNSSGTPLTAKGDGIVDTFSAAGVFQNRISSGLYEPYGMTFSGTSGYGEFDNDLLIADHFTGNVYAYTFGGKYVGSIRNSAGNLVTIPGIWTIVTPTGANDTLGQVYFSEEPGAHNTGELGLLELLKGSKYGSAG